MLNTEFTVIGVFEKIGTVLGQDRDNFAVIPLSSYLRLRGARQSLTLQIKAAGDKRTFEEAQDETRLTLRILNDERRFWADHRTNSAGSPT